MRTNRSHVRSVMAIICAFGATAPLSAQRAVPRVPSPAASGLSGYSIVFVVGDTEATGTSDTVPSAAQKALNDMQAFLPYKHYHLLDSAWILCCTDFGEPVSGRINGQDGHQYQYAIHTDPADGGRFSVHFSLVQEAAGGRGAARGGEISDTGRPEFARQLNEAIKDRYEAQLALNQAKRREEAGGAPASELQAAQARMQLADEQVLRLQTLVGYRGASASVPGTSIMDNSFYLALGETVVIGTSRLNGGQALVALLTAVPRSARKD